MKNTNTYEYLGRYLDRLRSQGRYTFTGDEVRSEFDLNDEAYQKVIQRLQDRSMIPRANIDAWCSAAAWQGFIRVMKFI